MSGFVVTLSDYVPPARSNGTPWTQAQITYSPDNVQAYTPLATINLVPLDSDPTHPTQRTFTVTNAPTAAGWLTVTFLDGSGNQAPTDPTQYPPVTSGSAHPSLLSARYGVRHRIRDGIPLLDANPVPFNTVRLEDLTDQIPTPQPATPTQNMFQVRFDDVPTQRYISVNAVPGTLVAFVDGSWTPTSPSADVDQNGMFTLPVVPLSSLRISYAWQYFSDGAIDYYVDESRRWLREFSSVAQVPDGLGHALVSYAASMAVRALARQANLARVRAGDSEVDWSSLAKDYQAEADALCKEADYEREQYYTQGPEARDPNAVDVIAVAISPYGPIR